MDNLTSPSNMWNVLILWIALSTWILTLEMFSDLIVSELVSCVLSVHLNDGINKGHHKITEHRGIFQRERQNSLVNKQTKSVNNRKTGKTAMALTWYRHFQRNGELNQILRRQISRFHYG